MIYEISLIDFETGEVLEQKSSHNLRDAHSLLDKSIGGQLAYNTTFQILVTFTTKRDVKQLDIF